MLKTNKLTYPPSFDILEHMAMTSLQILILSFRRTEVLVSYTVTVLQPGFVNKGLQFTYFKYL